MDDKSAVDVTMFKAGNGDCLFIRCIGEHPFRILIDGGLGGLNPTLKAFLNSLPEDERTIDLFVVTHIDADHITGALEILKDADLPEIIKEVWFNTSGQRTRDDPQPLSIEQGNELTKLLQTSKIAWNARLDGCAVSRSRHLSNVIPLNSSTTLTIVGPNAEAFELLKTKWDPSETVEEVEEELPEGVVRLANASAMPDVATLANSKYSKDGSVFNGSSIAFVLRHDETLVLISADTRAEYILDALEAEGCLSRGVSLATLPHHGSRRNFSPDLADQLHADNWFISTDGSTHHHPHAETIARLLKGLKQRGGATDLVFNSTHQEASVWDNELLRREYSYSVQFAAAEWITVRV
ncbi:MBL fold metallo-hydrolase [Rhizobium leguminosarum]